MADHVRGQERKQSGNAVEAAMSTEADRLLTIVVIGLNEEARLRDSLTSVFACKPRDFSLQVIYVDSGSTDRSLEIAASIEDVEILRLDARARSAAKARNLGLRHARGVYVQLVDGDSVVQGGWLDMAVNELERRPEVSCVFGQCVEVDPDQSIYMQVCGLDWHIPAGEYRLCGGNAMWRLSSIVANGYFDEALESGEEPDLCYRVRHSGGKIVCIDAPMVKHDLQMRRFSQYWLRGEKTGRGYACIAMRYRSKAEKLWLREFVMNFAEPLLWVLFAATGWIASGVSGAALALVIWWAARAVQIGFAMRGRGLSVARRLMYGFHCQFVRLPVAVGQLGALSSGAMAWRASTADDR